MSGRIDKRRLRDGWNAGEKAATLAHEFGVTVQAVNQARRGMGIPDRNRKRACIGAVAALLPVMTMTQIAALVGVTQPTVARYRDAVRGQ
jgi:predicted HD phosphohydrolase